ncbi:MAG: replication-associated recombination protein A, partial [Bacteroidia bacterium]
EEIRFIARRMLILASEDIGNANPTALALATACFQAVEMTGMPEARIILSQCATYLASSPKSNRAYLAIGMAQDTVRKTGDLPVPIHLRNAANSLLKNVGYGSGYQYPHDYPGGFALQEYLPDALRGTVFYDPGQNAREEEIRKFLRSRWADRYGY